MLYAFKITIPAIIYLERGEKQLPPPVKNIEAIAFNNAINSWFKDIIMHIAIRCKRIGDVKYTGAVPVRYFNSIFSCAAIIIFYLQPVFAGAADLYGRRSGIIAPKVC